MDGNTYSFPDPLTSLPKGTVVLLIYDGLGSAADDLDPADGKVVLHSPPAMVNIFDADGDQLADRYKYAAEQLLMEQRLFEASGIIARANISDKHIILAGPVPSLVFSANFSQGGELMLQVFDPNGVQVETGGPGISYRLDPTHEQYRIASPMPGIWQAVVGAKSPTPLSSTEYMLFASAPAEMQMHLVVSQLSRALFRVVVFLADSKPVAGASVSAQVLRPDGSIGELTLFDDGTHGDGAANDGTYGAALPVSLPGAYLIKATATGLDNNDEQFTRVAQETVIN